MRVLTFNEPATLWSIMTCHGTQCGWCKDKWGINWQITPRALTEAMALYRADGWSDIPAYTSFPATHWLGKAL